MLTATSLLEPDGRSTWTITRDDMVYLEEAEEQHARDRTAAELASLETLWAAS